MNIGSFIVKGKLEASTQEMCRKIFEKFFPEKIEIQPGKTYNLWQVLNSNTDQFERCLFQLSLTQLEECHAKVNSDRDEIVINFDSKYWIKFNRVFEGINFQAVLPWKKFSATDIFNIFGDEVRIDTIYNQCRKGWAESSQVASVVAVFSMKSNSLLAICQSIKKVNSCFQGDNLIINCWDSIDAVDMEQLCANLSDILAKTDVSIKYFVDTIFKTTIRLYGKFDIFDITIDHLIENDQYELKMKIYQADYHIEFVHEIDKKYPQFKKRYLVTYCQDMYTSTPLSLPYAFEI